MSLLRREQSTIRTKGSRTREDVLLPYALLAPAVLIVLAALVVPLFVLGNLSVRDVGLRRLEEVFQADLTTDHFSAVFSDSRTWRSLWVTALYVVGTSGVAFLIGLGTALLLNRKFPLRRVFRTLVIVPWAVPGVTATIAFLWMLAPTYGVVNFLLRTLGITDTDVNWFGDPDTAMFAVIMPTAWKSYPFFTVMLLAGLQTISAESYEASAVDGAGSWADFRYITWPGIRPFALLALVFNAMNSFREFDFIYASTQGGPAGVTETIAIRIYNLAFKAFDLGDSAALGIFAFFVVALIVIFGLRSQYKRTKEAAG